MTDQSASAPLDHRTKLALGAMALSVFVIANDFTSLSVALPQVERTFHTDVSTVQWVLNAYTLVFGVLIVTGGRLGDTFGRRRTFFVGLAIFALFSALATASWSSGTLIGARAAMGIGGALIWPAVVGLIFTLVPTQRAGLAGGLLIGVSGLGNAMGPLIGGLLTDALSWRWILALNLPIAAGAAALVYLYIAPDHGSETRERLDWAGVATLSTCLVALLVALDQASDWGWGDGRIIGLLAISGLAFAGFLVTQRRAGPDALIPPDVIGTRSFAAACVTIALVAGVWFVSMLYSPQYMEKILGFSALGAGVALLPLLLTFSVAAFGAGPIYNRIGALPLLLTGVICMPLGILLLSLASATSPYIATVPGLVLVGAGVGVFFSSVTNAALTSLDPSRTGVGSGLTFMFQLVSGAVGLGIATTVFTSVSANHAAARVGFVAGVHAALRVTAAIAACGLLSVWAIVRPGSPSEAPESPEPALAQ
ncbi:MAG TPA: MFS transporter [Solirubrobacteraceae bacterium]